VAYLLVLYLVFILSSKIQQQQNTKLHCISLVLDSCTVTQLHTPVSTTRETKTTVSTSLYQNTLDLFVYMSGHHILIKPRHRELFSKFVRNSCVLLGHFNLVSVQVYSK